MNVAVRITVTLWTKDRDGRPVGVSEFLLDGPDEARFVQRAQGLFKMVPLPSGPLVAQASVAGVSHEVDASRAAPEWVAARLWEEMRRVCPTG